jgi:F-type H+-transporting ATPase subunit alpha
MEHTIIIAAFNDDPSPVLYLTPYTALSIAEEYMMKGIDVLVVIDDLKRHANVHREMSLLMGKAPGREAYPADIFYTHSRMLEKGCQHKCGGSITVLPIVETKGGDITSYIPTNIISITDGQIFMSAKYFEQGQKPAISYGLSVSRLGGNVQTKEMKKLGAKVRRELLSYLETKAVYEMANEDEMSKEMQEKLRRGKRILDSLNQYKYSPLSQEQILERFETVLKEE